MSALSRSLPEPTRRSFRVARWLVRRLHRLVPADQRARWLAEWEAEIWYRAAHGRSLRPVTGALPHAASLRWQQWSPEAMFQDFRYAARQVRKAPVLSALIVLTMALGIGINALVYGVLSSTVLEPLPFEDADRIVYVWRQHPNNSWWMSPQMHQVRDWREQVDGFEEIVTLRGRTLTVSGLEEPTRINGAQVSPGFFDFMGVAPALGRTFTPEETLAGEPVVIISQRIWQQYFGGREDVLGATLRIDYEPHTVIGVMPGWFKMQSPFSLASLWLPLDEAGVERNINAIARLKPGTTVSQVNAELTALHQQRAAAEGAAATSPEEWIGQARRPQDFLSGDFQTTVWALQGAVAVVLLIATANVVNLLLARGSVRQQEMAVRAAIGGSRLRLMRQLMTECMLLTGVGGALGLGLAAAGVGILERLRPEEMNSLDTLRFDPVVALVTVGITLLAGLAAGLLPALQGASRNLQAQMAALSGRSSESSAQSRARGVLVVAEIALSTILLVGASLLVSSFVHLQQVDPGFDAQRLLTMRVGVPDRFADDSGGYWDEVLQSVRAAVGPRAEHVTLSTGVPPSGGVEFGAPQPESGELASQLDGVTSTSFVQADYFAAMGIDLLAGTTLPEEPAGDDETPMVVNEEFARQVWGHTDVVGERVRYGDEEPWRRVVGIVSEVKAFGLTSSGSQRQVYYGFKLHGGAERMGDGGLWLTIRTPEDPVALAPAVRRAVWSVDDEAPITDIATLHERMADSIALPRFNAWLMSSLAVVALGLAIVGVYGVLSYSVARRTHELGVRMALGATRGRLLGLVGRTSLVLIGSGLLLGIAGGAAASRLLTSMLHGIEPSDPVAYAVAAVLLLVVGLGATWRPALRAAGVDPAVALRND